MIGFPESIASFSAFIISSKLNGVVFSVVASVLSSFPSSFVFASAQFDFSLSIVVDSTSFVSFFDFCFC